MDDITERNLDILTGNPNTDPDKTPAADSYEIFPGPSGFEQFVQDKLYSPWRDQTARMLVATAFALTGSTAQIVDAKEQPSWWLVCVQFLAASSAEIALLTAQQALGDSSIIASVANYYYDGAAVQSIYGPVRRLIVKGHTPRLTLTPSGATASSIHRGIVYAIGEGIDPTRVGLF